MDLPQAYDADISSDPLEMVETILSDEGLNFERTPEGEVVFSLKGDWKAYDLWFSWRPEGECIQLCCTLDLPFTTAQLPSLYELLALVNQRVWFGHFELYQDEIGGHGASVADVVFRHTMAFSPAERPSPMQTAHMINSAAETVDRFYPAFDFLIRGGQAPQEAISACLFETVGEA